MSRPTTNRRVVPTAGLPRFAWGDTLSDMLAAPPSVPLSPVVIITLFLMLGLSVAMFWALVWRETSRRQWVALTEWGRETGFKFQPQALVEPPPPLTVLGDHQPRVRLCLSDGKSMLVQFQASIGRKNDEAHAQAFDGAGSGDAGGETVAIPPADEAVWGVLIRRIEAEWRPTGLRPSHAMTSVLDLYSLSSFPRLGNIERFVVYGTDSIAAAALSASSARALLPPDVGLLLHGRHLVVDFSARPFDATEFNRMLAVADQVVAHLPVGGE